MCDVTRRQKREVDSDFHSSARLIRRRDIARQNEVTLRLVCAYLPRFIGNGRCGGVI